MIYLHTPSHTTLLPCGPVYYRCCTVIWLIYTYGRDLSRVGLPPTLPPHAYIPHTTWTLPFPDGGISPHIWLLAPQFPFLTFWVDFTVATRCPTPRGCVPMVDLRYVVTQRLLPTTPFRLWCQFPIDFPLRLRYTVPTYSPTATLPCRYRDYVPAQPTFGWYLARTIPISPGYGSALARITPHITLPYPVDSPFVRSPVVVYHRYGYTVRCSLPNWFPVHYVFPYPMPLQVV